MDRETNRLPDLDKQNGGLGRTVKAPQNTNENQPAAEDISNVDRQEGDMNNGELGGDFKETKNNTGSKK